MEKVSQGSELTGDFPDTAPEPRSQNSETYFLRTCPRGRRALVRACMTPLALPRMLTTPFALPAGVPPVAGRPLGGVAMISHARAEHVHVGSARTVGPRGGQARLSAGFSPP